MSSNSAGHLEAAAGRVRAFNHASLATGQGWEWAPQAYTAIGSLSHLVGMLEQAVRQSTIPVAHTHNRGRLAIAGDGDPNQALAELLAAQADAERAAVELTRAVQRMHNAVSPMGVDTAGMAEFE